MNKFFSYLVWLISFSFSLSGWAYFPKVQQVVRFQPSVLRYQKPFRVKGEVQSQSQKFSYELYWYDPSTYVVNLIGIPRAFYFSDSQKAGNWTLIRSPKHGCILKTESLVAKCEGAEFWGLFELSGQPETVAKALAGAGFYSNAEIENQETDGRSLGVLAPFERVGGGGQNPLTVTPNQIVGLNRSVLSLGLNGNTPVAVLEIRGENFQYSGNLENSYPVLHFDQTFLAPLLARWKSDGLVYTIRAESDTEVRRRRPRFTHVLASKLEVMEGKNFLATFSRNESEDLGQKAARPQVLTDPPKTTSDLSALRGIISTEGQSFLTAFFLTH